MGILITFLLESLHSRFVDAFVVAIKHTSNLYPDSLFSDQYGLKYYNPKDDGVLFSISKFQT